MRVMQDTLDALAAERRSRSSDELMRVGAETRIAAPVEAVWGIAADPARR